MASTEDIKAALDICSRPSAIPTAEKFFQAFPGGYGEGDQFLAVKVPDQRKIAREVYTNTSLEALTELIQSPIHDHRLTAIFIAVNQFEKKTKSPHTQEEIVQWYLNHLEGVNNWDIVDSSCYKILGPWLENRDRKLLYDLANEPSVWKRRIAMVTTKAWIKDGDHEDLFTLADKLYSAPEVILQKAIGWMLKEAAAIDPQRVIDFVEARPEPKLIRRIAFEKL